MPEADADPQRALTKTRFLQNRSHTGIGNCFSAVYCAVKSVRRGKGCPDSEGRGHVDSAFFFVTKPESFTGFELDNDIFGSLILKDKFCFFVSNTQLAGKIAVGPVWSW